MASTIDIEAKDADELVAAVEHELATGVDLIKLYLGGPDTETSPWSAEEVSHAVAAARDHGATVTAHATRLSGRERVFSAVSTVLSTAATWMLILPVKWWHGGPC